MDITKSNYFFIIFLVTILITRIFLYFRPTPSPTVKGFRLHHYMYGLLLIPVGLVTNITIYAVGAGLFIDELTYLLMNGETHKDNYSPLSLAGTLLFIILIYFFRKKLVF